MKSMSRGLSSEFNVKHVMNNIKFGNELIKDMFFDDDLKIMINETVTPK